MVLILLVSYAYAHIYCVQYIRKMRVSYPHCIQSIMLKYWRPFPDSLSDFRSSFPFPISVSDFRFIRFHLPHVNSCSIYCSQLHNLAKSRCCQTQKWVLSQKRGVLYRARNHDSEHDKGRSTTVVERQVTGTCTLESKYYQSKFQSTFQSISPVQSPGFALTRWKQIVRENHVQYLSHIGHRLVFFYCSFFL